MLGLCSVNNSFAAEDRLAPSLELLEYLGRMIEEDDNLIGPEDLDDEPEPFPDSILVDDVSPKDASLKDGSAKDDSAIEAEGSYRD